MMFVSTYKNYNVKHEPWNQSER